MITWCNRGTLHLVASEDYPWLQALTTPPLVTSSTRRLAQEGLPPAVAGRAVEVVRRALTDDGPLTREALRDRLQRADIPVAGQALVDLRARGRRGRLPPPRLLGPWEPVLVGWSSRTPVLGEHDAKVVTGGLFRGFAMVAGRGVATWRLTDSAVTIEPFAPISDADARALRDDAAAVSRFLGRYSDSTATGSPSTRSPSTEPPASD